VTLHSHTPNQNINNNVIEHNIIETNNVRGDDDAGVTQTTGVLIFVADPSVTVHGTQIRHNIIEDNHFGIWLTHGHVDTGGISHNVFANVAVDIKS
jgi:nitrous oxidase accessory protein NosD